MQRGARAGVQRAVRGPREDAGGVLQARRGRGGGLSAAVGQGAGEAALQRALQHLEQHEKRMPGRVRAERELPVRVPVQDGAQDLRHDHAAALPAAAAARGERGVRLRAGVGRLQQEELHLPRRAALPAHQLQRRAGLPAAAQPVLRSPVGQRAHPGAHHGGPLVRVRGRQVRAAGRDEHRSHPEHHDVRPAPGLRQDLPQADLLDGGGADPGGLLPRPDARRADRRPVLRALRLLHERHPAGRVQHRAHHAGVGVQLRVLRDEPVAAQLCGPRPTCVRNF
mmetsp:Transcript_6713/g.25961  ORF Transcript_6713/g.25961 Transcript_6713/m.25961 type:complete len:281 (-) Transcript_6713:980-1822(-)